MNLISCKISDFSSDEMWVMYNVENRVDPRKDSMIAHYFAKKFIADRLPSKVKNVHFKYTDAGKPYYDDNHHFSISHSNEYIFVTYSNKPTGVDSEILRKINPKFIYKVLAENEIDNNADFSIEFLKAWTLKEAYLKLKGHKVCEFQQITKQKLSDDHTIITNVTEEYIMTAVFEE